MKKRITALVSLLFTAALFAAMSTGSFSQLLKSIEDESFSDDKLSVVEMASAQNYFTCAQVVEILNRFSFSDDKLQALRLLKDNIEDLNNQYTIINAFFSSDDKSKAKAILAQAKFKGESQNSSQQSGSSSNSSGDSSGYCTCKVTCSDGQSESLQLPNEGSASYMDTRCEQKGMSFCSSISMSVRVRKTSVSCN